MPCDSVVLNSVNLDKVTDLDMLKRALEAEFGRVQSWAPGQFSFEANGYDVELVNGTASSQMSRGELQKVVGQIKQSYSRQAVEFAAKRFGWVVKRSGTNPNKFSIIKR